MREIQRQSVRTARVAGIWYLLLAISGIVGFMVLHAKIYTSNPETTLVNLTESEGLARLRLLFELLIVISQALAALWFYRLFKGISDWQAWAVGVWGMVNSVVIMVSAIAMAAAIQIANSSVLTPDNKVAVIELLGLLIRHSWNVGGLFFGLWLIPMGYCVILSKRMPQWLGRILIIGGFGYIANTLVYYTGFQYSLSGILTMPATVGEFWMIGYLLIYGMRPMHERLEATGNENN